jgi:hypothetical protein
VLQHDDVISLAQRRAAARSTPDRAAYVPRIATGSIRVRATTAWVFG